MQPGSGIFTTAQTVAVIWVSCSCQTCTCVTTVALLLCSQARRILETELQDERAGRSAAEEARAKAEAERSRLQLAQVP